MPQARKRLVSLDDTPYYHCISRCVRRAFLCGRDPLTGFNFEHRRQWIVDRIKRLSAVFAVDLCAYAVMSNHYHIVVRIDVAQAQQWSDIEVAKRWTEIFTKPPVISMLLAGFPLSPGEQNEAARLLKTWRGRLANLSWLMRCLNEPIARMANREDHCTGCFWEGRFKSQALLDQRALLACMAYVDLNPIRAKMAATPEASDYTSIQERIRHPQRQSLRPLVGGSDDSKGIPMSLPDYLQLVDWAGRQIRRGKRGYIAAQTPPILVRLGMQSAPVLAYLGKTGAHSLGALGPVSMLRAFADSVGRRFVKGHKTGRSICPESN